MTTHPTTEDTRTPDWAEIANWIIVATIIVSTAALLRGLL